MYQQNIINNPEIVLEHFQMIVNFQRDIIKSFLD